MQNCSLLEEEANARAYALLRESYKKVISYDEQTKHGRLQGAVFFHSNAYATVSSIGSGWKALPGGGSVVSVNAVPTPLSPRRPLDGPRAPQPTGA